MGNRGALRALTARAIFGVSLVVLASGMPNAKADCEEIFAGPEVSDRIYGAGVNPAVEPNGHIRYGFESEYTMAESIPLLQLYGPHPRFGVSREVWLQKTGEERLAWVKEKVARIPEFGEESGLVLFVKEPGLEFMPDSLVLDSTGNLEIVLPPVETYKTWKTQVDAINKRFGVGSQQAMISSPSQPYFLAGAPADRRWAGTGRVLDFLAVIHEVDTLQKLQNGGERYSKDPTKATALSFLHPFLGPMTALKRNALERYILRNADGEMYSDADVKFVRKSDASFKYIGGTVYRPDIGMQERLAFEVRDAHKNPELLAAQVQRLIQFFERSDNPFAGASQMGTFDPVATFEKVPAHLRDVLKTLAPTKTKPGFEYSKEEIQSLEVYRNFSYPLREWNRALEFLGRTDISTEVAKAQARYLDRLNDIATEVKAGKITNAEALLRLQGAVSVFAVESGLPNAFKTWMEQKQKATTHSESAAVPNAA